MLRLPAFRYLRPSSVEEAARMLADNGGRARLVAGGTDLFPKMKRRQVQPGVLIGLSHLDLLRTLKVAPSGATEIGAAMTLASAASDAGLRRGQPGYVEAAGTVSSPALRNVGTIGGNLCVDTRCNYNDMTEEWREAIGFCLKTGGDECRVAASSPRCWAISSSDTAPMAIALGASVVIVGPEGEREVPVAALYRDDGADHLTIGPDEIVSCLRLPARQGWGAAYEKLRRRSSMDFSLAGAAVAIAMDGPVVQDCRIALGAVASLPFEATAASAGLVGKKLDDEAILEAAAGAAKQAKPLDNADSSYVWRKRMVSVIVERALRRAAASA